MEKLLSYVEAEAKANMSFHVANADSISKDSTSFLNLVLAGAGALAALLVSLLTKTEVALPLWQLIAIGSASAYLFIVAGLTLWKCLWVIEISAPANEPKNFPLRGFTLDEVREAELSNRQICIEANIRRNEIVGGWLNRCRAMAAATPLVSALVVGVVAVAVAN